MLVNASIFNGFQYRRIQGFTRVSPLILLLKLGHLQSERSVKRSQRSKRNVTIRVTFEIDVLIDVLMR